MWMSYQVVMVDVVLLLDCCTVVYVCNDVLTVVSCSIVVADYYYWGVDFLFDSNVVFVDCFCYQQPFAVDDGHHRIDIRLGLVLDLLCLVWA